MGSAVADPATRANRRWTEENVDPPVDLRLVPMALGLWAGCATALLAGITVFRGLLLWVAVLAAVFGVVLLTRTGRWQHGTAVALIAVAAGLGVSGAALWSAAADPLTDAAAHGRFVRLTMTVGSGAVAMPTAFGGEDQPGTAGPDADPAGRYRLSGTAVHTEVADRQWDADTPLTIIGTGEEWRNLVPGQRITAGGLLAPDSFPVIPGVQLRATGPPQVLAVAPWWHRAAAAIRSGLTNRSAALGGDAGALLPGLVVGDTSGIDDRLNADAKATGLTHLLAVSGSHFAIVCGAVVLLLRRFGPRFAATGGALVLAGLVVLVGPQPSVLRAAVMGALTVAALFAGRTRTALPALAAAIVVLVIVDPALALSPGFTMSVLATGGLVLLAPAWSKALQRKGFPRGWADVLAVPPAATIVTLPVVVALSGAIPIASIPANLLAAAAVPPALIIGLFCALAGPLSDPVADALAAADRPLLNWIAWVAHTLVRAPNATATWPTGLPWILLLTGVLIGGLGVLRRQRIRTLAGAAAAGFAVVLLPVQVLPPIGWPPPGWLLAGCEVGQGDAFVLSTEQRGTAVVVDTGPEPSLVDQCLDQLGVGTVPLLVLTHLHADHVDGLAGALDGRSVGMIAVGPGRDPAPAWAAVLRVAALRGIPVVQLHPGDGWSAAGLTIDVLGPAAAFTGTDSDPNNDSLVLRATRAGVRMLMSGDVEPQAQRALLRSGADLRAQVLKVPHHGSAKDLPEFIAAVSPQVALIGVGRDNDYGHPSPKLLDRLTAAGVGDIERTDTMGDIAVGLIDGRLTAAHRGSMLHGP
jgi:competence protein ComEC